jgi:RecB family exonuclease
LLACATDSAQSAPQWLKPSDWQAAFPGVVQWFGYGAAVPAAVMAQLCAARLGEPPKHAVVEHPWQAQWLLRQCAAYLQRLNHAAPLPQVLTLGQWLNLRLSQSADALAAPATVTAQQAALQLTAALKVLRVDAIHSDRARYGLASEMVKLMAEMTLREHLSSTIALAGQDAAQRLAQPTWLSREAQWLHLAQASLSDQQASNSLAASPASPPALAWLEQLRQLAPLAAGAQLALVLPAPHPSVLMQAFLSQPLNADCAVGLPDLAQHHTDITANTTINTTSNNFDDSNAETTVTVTQCESFEHEAIIAADLISALLDPTNPQNSKNPKHPANPASINDTSKHPPKATAEPAPTAPQNVTIVAHDRILARRVAALLARRGVAVEDRVGWALSTTVAATVVRGVLSSWQGNDVPALMGWLALPMVAQHWPDARPTLALLRQRWHAESIVPDGRAFIKRVIWLAQTAGDAAGQNAAACLEHWQAAQQQFTQPKAERSVAAFAADLLAFLAPLTPALQADAAGGKVWQQLRSLGAGGGALADTKVSFATFVAVLDETLEGERFSASNANHADHAARAVFAPFYEAAWLDAAHTVMLGCNETHLPATPRSPTPLLSSVRRELGLPQPAVERAVWQHLLAQRGKQLHATFTASEAGNPSRISPWLLAYPVNQAVQPSTLVNVASDIDTVETLETLEIVETVEIVEIVETLAPLETSLETRLENAKPPCAALALNAMPTEISVTKLASIVQCPYRFALSSVFGIRPLDEPALWPSQMERGNLLHDALHAVNADPALPLHTLNAPDALRSAIHAALQALLPNKLPFSGRYAALVADSQRTVDTYVAAHSARQAEGWRIHAAEHTVESTDLIAGVRVHGKLDRIDAIRGNSQTIHGFAVLDYKTTAQAALAAKRDAPLLDAQLALYTALLEANDQPTAQAAYWRLHDGLHDSTVQAGDDSSAANVQYHEKKTFFALADLPNQTDAVTGAVRLAWQKAAASHSAAATPSDSACEYCAYRGVCRSNGVAVIDDEASTASIALRGRAGAAHEGSQGEADE